MWDVTATLLDLLLTRTICLHLFKQFSPFIVHHRTRYSKSATFWSFRLISTNLFSPSWQIHHFLFWFVTAILGSCGMVQAEVLRTRDGEKKMV